MALKELVATSNLGDIALIKSLLESEDIPYLAHGEHFHMVRPLVEPVRFLIPEEHMDRAKPLIDSLRLTYGSFADFNPSDPSSDGDPSEDSA